MENGVQCPFICADDAARNLYAIASRTVQTELYLIWLKTRAVFFRNQWGLYSFISAKQGYLSVCLFFLFFSKCLQRHN